MGMVRTLESPPSLLPAYGRAAVSLLPGAALLPFVPGRGNQIPDVEFVLPGVRADAGKVAAYARVCGFALRDELPPTYPHVLAFPLHMAVMADGRFPFGAVGLVHIENRIVQHRPIGLGEELEIRVRPTQLEPHPRGRSFAFISEAFVDGELVWEDASRILRRGGGKPGSSTATPQGSTRTGAGGSPAGGAAEGAAVPKRGAEWELSGDLGRRYAAVSGDRNPIHVHPLLARPFGFPGAIAHGMWTKARCLAALEARLPGAFSAEVRFRRPIVLPARVAFANAQHGERIDFSVSDANRGTPHLEGHTLPLVASRQSEERSTDER
jgi:acyl dehydratase